MHTIRWSNLVKAKKEKSIFLRNLNTMNKACLAKLYWKLFKGDNALWCSVLKGKYGRNYEGNDIGEAKFIIRVFGGI